ncbi:MAG TPA: hypothetical protein VME86_16950 [Acidobacteriaceae bacterium]|nr:hypothetical protein [Acidobacteriaceae bacterium]
MLKIIEYSLLAVSLLVVIGLVMSGSRGGPESSSKQDQAPPKDNSEAHDPGKTT